MGASLAARVASSFLGTGAVDFLSSSRRAGEMVRKSTPAKEVISPVCHRKQKSELTQVNRVRKRTLRKEAPMTMVLYPCCL